MSSSSSATPITTPPAATPPTMSAVAAARWHHTAPALSPWLHEEVARRMEARLQWIVQPPAHWCHWDPVRGGLQAHELLRQRYPDGQCHITETAATRQASAKAALTPAWWSAARWKGSATQFGPPADGAMQMLWANMALHMSSNPQALLTQWHRALAVDGYLMFSCLGPDTLQELRGLYAALGWPAPCHQYTDMHDWGDMLVHTGFAEPVMDMERITLTFASPQRLLQELRELGRNLHPQRFAGLRGRGWHAKLLEQISQQLAQPQEDGSLALTFEIIYGHAFKPAPRVRVASESAVSLQDMRAMLRGSTAP